MKKQRSFLRSILLGLVILVVLVIYAYGFQVTRVNLEETRDPVRQTQLTRILRALARPDIFTYDKEEFIVSLLIYTPCPVDGTGVPEVDTSGPYMVMTPACAEPKTEVTVEGFNFEPNTQGPLNFIPPSGASLQMGTIKTDSDGHFLVTVELPKRPDTVAQEIRAVTRRNVGMPHFSQNAIETWNKIVETVFMAMLATTLGVAIAMPASFLAARNIMTPITSPFTSVALMILALPLGLLAGAKASSWMSSLSEMLTRDVWVNLAALVIVPLLLWFGLRWALPPEEAKVPPPALRAARLFVMLVLALLGILAFFLLSALTMRFGRSLIEPLGAVGFLGKFVVSLGDILGFSTPVLSALMGAGVLASAAGRLGQWIVEHSSTSLNRIANFVLGTAAGATLFAMIGAGIDWLYQLENLTATLIVPAILGGIAGAVTAGVLSRRATLPIGFVIYTIMRTLFNGLRSIESLVMVIVFAVWVGIGPFAGVLALALHTIVSNAKLYSEQVEAIMPGPLEAVTATGANRLQAIIYAVIPQIIPPFISYTMYRWDINVRMSTIIGFAGGGGIGFLLFQNVNLLNYRAASAQMLAIAVVVATMDYVSSKLREKAI
ncbi:MAG: ABC transporter permease subunit [Anaerolineales bacterium]|nr:ABC transporter permease subunit [Anaerolineales bacterium]